MIIRTFHIALLLAFCSGATAEPLYKWTEADGSITFSPVKPQKGIDFKVINADEGVTPSKIAVREAATPPDTSQIDSTESARASHTQPISYSSTRLAQPMASSFASADQLDSRKLYADSEGSNAGKQASMAAMTKLTRQTSESATAAVQKQNECEDLRKRVVSLERRLRSKLTPADMDNTVVRMSKYQNSYARDCEL